MFASVLLLGGYLRSVGLTWGLESGYGHFRNFHSDEFISLRGVLEIDLLRGRIKAPGAYFEGTFNYYLWAIPVAAIKLAHESGPKPLNLTDNAHFAQILFLCRIMTVAFDVLAIFVVFLAAYEATQSFFPALFAGFFYSIILMQVIYAHFMRTHALSNLLCALVIWLSLKLIKTPTRWLSLAAGIFSGLGAATRFPNCVIVAIPCLFLLFTRPSASTSWISQLRRSTLYLLSGPIWWIGLGFLGGLFIGEPVLFFDPRSVIDGIVRGSSPYVPDQAFALTTLFDLSRLWIYLSVLTPFAMYPALWIVVYGAILYLCFRGGLYRLTLPILIFFLLYLYPMAKGYGKYPVYPHATMLLFPGFCILAGLALSDLWLLLKRHRAAAISLITAALLLTLPSIAFDLAYVKAMQQRDPRSALREDLKTLIRDSAVTIGVLKYAGYFHTVMPAVDPLKSEKVTVQLQDPGQKADFFLVGLGAPIDSTQRDATIRNVEKQGNFKYERSYRNCPEVFGREFPLSRFPIDMTFPFPTILLFRSKTGT